ncbi:decapping nuclease DXO homolog isoform X1 [Ceratitis capitata]|uniref:decapping nuclease DXO homolog isoform X1 n=1 Tax=Ceratitis capitata TaxID=7213 RepID=UPI00032A0C72|nr:decapping nuclease DXO homolog isoform X1 [Ceratitis capitata]
MFAYHTSDGYDVLLEVTHELFDDDLQDLVFIDRPRICAIYTCSSTGEITKTERLKYFKSPKPSLYPINLNEGFDEYIFRPKVELTHLLDTVQKYILETKESVLQPDALNSEKSEGNAKRKLILCIRGALARIMAIPYRLQATKYNDFTIYASKYCDILHLTEFGWADRCTEEDSYHGKFVQTCFSYDPNEDPITDEPFDENSVPFGVYHTSLRKFDLIYSAEIGGVISDKKIDIQNMEEVNKSRFLMTKLLRAGNYSEETLNNPKCLIWWLQSYLTDTQDICFGLKNRNGIINHPVRVNTVNDIRNNRRWEPHICTGFLYSMLTLIEETMADVDCPYTVFEFQRDSFAGCIKFRKHTGKTEYSFLSEEYIKHCKERFDKI